MKLSAAYEVDFNFQILSLIFLLLPRQIKFEPKFYDRNYVHGMIIS